MAALLRSEKHLADVTRGATEAFYIVFKENNDKILERFVEELKIIVKNAYAGGDWPDNIDPLPWVRMTLAGMYYNNAKLVPALRYGLKGSLFGQRRTGFAWMADLMDVARILVSMSQESADSPVFQLDTFPSREQLRIITAGYLQELCLATKKAFGLDTTFTQAVLRYASAFRHIPGQPGPGTKEFKMRFNEAQQKLLEWADIGKDRAVKLTQGARLDDLEEALNGLTIEKKN